MASAAVEPPVVEEAPSSSGPGVGQKRSRKDAEEVPTAPLPDVLSLPVASIMRIIKSKLPDGVMVGTETKKAFGKACSLFILYLTTIASDVAKEGNRSTVHGQDVLAALRDLEFDDLLPSVESALAAFREAEKARSIEQAAKRAAKVGDAPAAEGDDEEDGKDGKDGKEGEKMNDDDEEAAEPEGGAEEEEEEE